jgi:hypothetical protein
MSASRHRFHEKCMRTPFFARGHKVWTLIDVAQVISPSSLPAAISYPVGEPLTGDEGPVTGVGAARLADGRAMIVSGGADCTVRR